MLKCHLYFLFFFHFRQFLTINIVVTAMTWFDANQSKRANHYVTLMLLCGSFYFKRSLFANNLNGNQTQMPSLSLSTQPYENKPAAINTSQHSSLNWCLLFILTRKHTHTYIHFKYYHAKTINE